jgi:hypothetical protein
MVVTTLSHYACLQFSHHQRATYLQRWAPDTSNQIQSFVHGYVEENVIVEVGLRGLRGRANGTG